MSDAMHALDPQTIAERVRDGMFPADAASHGLGLSFVSVGPGCAKMTMSVRADMLNGLKVITNRPWPPASASISRRPPTSAMY
jgi:hypothetical protein